MIAPDPAAAILRASTYRRTRWKNGGGETMEVAISPPGSSLDYFDWRISMAIVATDGPFSLFAGVDRTLCILDGAGIELCLADAPARRLNAASAPLSFSGDEAAHARLIDGPVTDFNVMTRRNRFSHTVQRVRLHAGEERHMPPDVRAIFCEAGIVSVELIALIESIKTPRRRDRLEPRDTMIRQVSDRRTSNLFAETAATVCLVTISVSPRANFVRDPRNASKYFT